jgi:hypothetical protein
LPYPRTPRTGTASNMSETRQPDSSRLHIPIEIFFRVLNFVPIDHILQFRTLCRAARDEIDTRMLYSYIRRTKLPSCPSRSAVEHAALEYNNLLALLRGTATFSHLAPNSSPSISSPIWAGTHAVFQFDAGWISAYREMCALATLFSSQTMDAIKGDFRKPFSPHYTPVWYAQLDNAVLDLDVRWWPGDPLQTFDLYNGTLSIPWRRMLKSFLVAETKISFMVAQHTDKVRRIPTITCAYSN